MIRNSLAALLLIILMGAMQPLQAEIRAIWVLPWSTNTPEKIDAFISSAVESYQTDVFVEIRYRADAMYVTNRVPDIYPNPEPRSYILTDCAFDPLAYILEVGHKNNLRVHAWFVVWELKRLWESDEARRKKGTKPATGPQLQELRSLGINELADLSQEEAATLLKNLDLAKRSREDEEKEPY